MKIEPPVGISKNFVKFKLLLFQYVRFQIF